MHKVFWLKCRNIVYVELPLSIVLYILSRPNSHSLLLALTFPGSMVAIHGTWVGHVLWVMHRLSAEQLESFTTTLTTLTRVMISFLCVVMICFIAFDYL